MRNRLIDRIGRAKVRLQRVALYVLDQMPARLRIRQDRDREVPLGDYLEKQDVPGERAAMPERMNRTDLTDVPRESDVVIGTLLVRLNRAHLLERFAREHALALRRGAV